jgi:hypothetical protein
VCDARVEKRAAAAAGELAESLDACIGCYYLHHRSHCCARNQNFLYISSDFNEVLTTDYKIVHAADTFLTLPFQGQEWNTILNVDRKSKLREVVARQAY